MSDPLNPSERTENAFPGALCGAESRGQGDGMPVWGGNFAFRQGGSRISSMQKAKVIAKQPPMPPTDKVAGDSSIGVRTARQWGEI